MSPTVKSIDEQAIMKKLKDSGQKDVINYINKLKESSKGWQEIAQKAINKLKNEYKNI